MDGKTLELEKDFEVSPYFWNVKDRLDYYQTKSPITKQALLAKNVLFPPFPLSYPPLSHPFFLIIFLVE